MPEQDLRSAGKTTDSIPHFVCWVAKVHTTTVLKV